MTQAFNLAQLANNLNTSGQLDATDGLNGLVANANLASSGTASSSTYLRGDRTWASITQGKILQVVTTQSTAYYSFSSAGVDTFTDVSGLSVNITPSSTSSRVMILLYSSLSNERVWLRLMRGSTPIAYGDQYGGGSRSSFFQMYPRGTSVNIAWVDSPSTTSSTTYKLQQSGETGKTFYLGSAWNEAGGAAVSQFPSTATSLIAMEIAP